MATFDEIELLANLLNRLENQIKAKDKLYNGSKEGILTILTLQNEINGVMMAAMELGIPIRLLRQIQNCKTADTPSTSPAPDSEPMISVARLTEILHKAKLPIDLDINNGAGDLTENLRNLALVNSIARECGITLD
jgi:hypothetical protein